MLPVWLKFSVYKPRGTVLKIIFLTGCQCLDLNAGIIFSYLYVLVPTLGKEFWALWSFWKLDLVMQVS